LDPFSGPTGDSTPTISGTTDAAVGSIVTISVGGQSFTAIVAAGGVFSAAVPLPLAAGPHTVTATVSDPAGNIGSDSGTVQILAGTISLSGADSSADPHQPTLSGSTDLSVGTVITLTIDGRTFTTLVRSDGTFSVKVPFALPDGTYSVLATGTDASGNLVSSVLGLSVVSPAVTVSPTSVPASSATPTSTPTSAAQTTKATPSPTASRTSSPAPRPAATTPAPPPLADSLPFTGAEIGAWSGAAALLIGLGVAVLLASRRRPQS
jgi:hypothetical protein